VNAGFIRKSQIFMLPIMTKNAPVTKYFFATVQNKLHWAITGKTAAEIIYTSAEATKLYMGLTNWKQPLFLGRKIVALPPVIPNGLQKAKGSL
jgi:hypothetical protein